MSKSPTNVSIAHRSLVAPAVLAASLLVGLSGCASGTALRSEPMGEASAAVAMPSWSYAGADGPAAWAGLDESFQSCTTGTHQSPIDLPASPPTAPTSPSTITTDPLPTVGEVIDTGHAMQFVPETHGSTVDFEGKEYDLLQMHVHTPSEHTIDGNAAAAEFHFVHATDDGDLLVVGVLAQEGTASAQWQPFIASAAGDAAPETALHLSALLPAGSGYYAYEGSLTTPPCTEGVRWIVLSNPVTLSVDQLVQLAGEHAHNARPVADLGERDITGGTLGG